MIDHWLSRRHVIIAVSDKFLKAQSSSQQRIDRFEKHAWQLVMLLIILRNDDQIPIFKQQQPSKHEKFGRTACNFIIFFFMQNHVFAWREARL